MATTNEPIVCFAVTDQFAIIPLREIARTETDGMTLIETKIDGDVEYVSHCECHHRIYFREMWLDDDGKPDKGTVFMTLSEAKKWVASSIKIKIAEKRRELKSLQTKLDKLWGVM